ncbi:response regulator transcription factor [Sphaerobacter sp.]|uniref:response regulator transcription factor n=1 Tax=Sphaerobacter sp. TaxID=2099654 RepID=UPI001D4F38A4|nr:response regulator transcription factor [Sphaerobacter sp.]MBX5446260.1 response regulator transcription factor [Sphaerobacter sp.]
MRILVVDDDPRIRETLAGPLGAAGYDVTAVGDGAAALAAVERGRPDLIILDVAMPGMDGFAVCRELRAYEELSGLPRTPVIFLTVRDDFASEETGFQSGADDYVAKPFSIPALLARVRLRLPNSPVRVIDDYLRLDLTRRDVAVRRDGVWQPVRLQPLEYALLERLYLNAGIWISRSDLLEQVFDRDDEDTKAVEKYIHFLRQKLEPDPKAPIYIQSMRSVGYRFKPLDRAG